MPLTFSFDCYGTLIDWESGILVAMQPVIGRHELVCQSEDVLRAYARAEAAVEAGPYLPYVEVLRRTFAAMAKDLGFAPGPGELETLVEALPRWQPFPDTVASLRALQAAGHRLVILSNVDDELFAAGTAAALEVDFDAVITAAQVQRYKPHPAMFERAFERLGLAPAELVHCGQSRYHDVAPARALGAKTVLVTRDVGRSPGGSATPGLDELGDPAAAEPDWTVPDLASLVRLVPKIEAALAETRQGSQA